MADSLDDFFAKKDKSKKSKKKNFTSEEIAKRMLEESGNKKSEKTRKAKDKSNVGAIITNMAEQEDEEWNDFEEEREKDYSGLKIQTLSIKDKEEELREQQLQELEEEKQKESAVGPWKLSPTDKSDNESDTERASPEEPEKETIASRPAPQAADGPNKYVPPHMRNQPKETSMNPGSHLPTRRKGNAPQIGNPVEFPSLGPMDSNEDNKGFQTVRHGIRESSPNRKAPNVTLDNKYGLLRNND